jgi:hypothetical protein
MGTVSIVRATAGEFRSGWTGRCRSYSKFLLYLGVFSCNEYSAIICHFEIAFELQALVE